MAATNPSSTPITEAAMEKYMFAKISPASQSIITRVYLAGMKLLFSSQMHSQLLQEFQQQVQQGHAIGDVLGTDIAHIVLILYQESKGTMPKGAMIPAGTLLLAKATEFLNESKLDQVTSSDFADAVRIMSTAIQAKADPNFAQRMGAAQPQAAQPTPPAQPMQQPPQGLLGAPQ